MNLGHHLVRQTAAFADLVEDLDPDGQVPTCPDWTLGVLVGHIGQAPRWMAGIVRTREADAIPDPHDAKPGPQDEWGAWLTSGADELVAAVDQDPQATVWTMVGPRPASFWTRRMLCDLAVHHADAAITAGVPYRVDPEVAAEAISEGLDLYGDVQALPGQGETLLLRPNEMEPWLITRTPGGAVTERGGKDADVVLAGPVRDLLLMLTRRIPVEDQAVTGDRALLDHWLANPPF